MLAGSNTKFGFSMVTPGYAGSDILRVHIHTSHTSVPDDLRRTRSV